MNNSRKKNVDGELLSEEDRKQARKLFKQECFFEYDMKQDVFWISRNSAFLDDMNGIKITNCIEKQIGRAHV